jgi:glycolate oxidase FAD binding subunit
MSFGNAPVRFDIALITTRLHRVVEYEAADLTITVESGMTLGTLKQHLSDHGQFLPIDGPDEATIGGLLAVGHGGPSQHMYGLPRDWLLGCKLALADGTIVRAGGRVVKNVAGYDMTRMAVGSLGTLGVIVEATLKVAPIPAAQETLLVAHAETSSALEAAKAASKRGLALRSVAVVENQVAYWLSGSSAAVDRSRNELREITGEVEARQIEGVAAERWWASLNRLDATSDLTLRVAVPPSDVSAIVLAMEAATENVTAAIKRVAYPAAGVIIGRLTEGSVEAYVDVIEWVRRDAVSRGGSLVATKSPGDAKNKIGGGSLVATKSPGDAKNKIDVWGDSPALPLMRKLKHEFDPKGTLNPGRFIGGI